MGNTDECPACSASLAKGSAKCSACQSSVESQNDPSVLASAGPALGHVAIVTLIAIISASLVVAAILLALVNS
jgi:hypothetical protein